MSEHSSPFSSTFPVFTDGYTTESNSLALFQSLCRSKDLDVWEGWQDTHSEHVQIFCTTEAMKCEPMIYDPGLVITMIGEKRLQVADYRLQTGPNNWFLLTSSYPIICESNATPKNPLYGLVLKFQPEVIFKFVELMKAQNAKIDEDSSNFPVGFAITPKTPRLDNCLSRLLLALHNKIEAAALIDGIIDEIFFLLIQSPQGQILLNYAVQDSTFYKVSKAVTFINENYANRVSIDQMADIAGMSTSAFHRAFKRCITDSPLQYLKKIRLSQAKKYMLSDGQSISEVAFKVGYESVPQFSREFKRYFGFSPSQTSVS